MILVDSSVWIDYFRGRENLHTQQLDEWLDAPEEQLGLADLVAFEVLRGFNTNRERQQAEDLLLDLPMVNIGGIDNALRAAEHDRALRAKGYTIRSPIDVLLASYCITHGYTLLHHDADFDVMEILRGLKTWPH